MNSVTTARWIVFGTLAVFGAIVTMGAWRTFSTSDVAAFEAMTPAERAHLKTLRTIRQSTSEHELVALLGAPDERSALSGHVRLSYEEVAGSSLSVVNVSIRDGRVYRIAWLKLGRFSYTIEPES